METYIYALSSSDDPTEFKYVGMTATSLEARKMAHIYASATQTLTPSLAWVKSVLDDGNEIIITALAIDIHGNHDDTERYWIRILRKMGFDLTNVDDGGKSGIVIYNQYQQSIKKSKWFKKLPIEEQFKIRMKWVPYRKPDLKVFNAFVLV